MHTYPSLYQPGGPATFCLLGIDPGSTNMGIAALQVNIADLKISGYEAFTIDATHPCGGARLPEWKEELVAPRTVRMDELAFRLRNIFVYYKPLQIASESPFFNPKNPNAFAVLVEVLKIIEEAVRDYSAWRPLYRIEPSAAKKAVAPQLESERQRLRLIKDSKIRIRETVRVFPELQFLPVDALDEHALDACVVAFCQLQRLRNSDFSLTN